MLKKHLVSAVLGGLLIGVASGAMACGGANSGKHIGNITSIDKNKSTFSIKDMESQKTLTFKANNDIMSVLKTASGNVMVNYEEDDEGALKAVGVTF
jgi:hypothetical protein